MRDVCPYLRKTQAPEAQSSFVWPSGNLQWSKHSILPSFLEQKGNNTRRKWAAGTFYFSFKKNFSDKRNREFKRKKWETIKMIWILCLYFVVGSIVFSYMGTVVILWLVRVFFPNYICMFLKCLLSYPPKSLLNNFIIPFRTFEFCINLVF